MMEKHIREKDDISFRGIIFQLQNWWKYLLSKWLIIIVAGLIGASLGVVYAYSQKPVYVAELTFVLEDDQSKGGIGGYAGLAGQFGIDIGGTSGGGAFAGDNLLPLMKSRSMIQKAFLATVAINGKNQTLADFYIDAYKLRGEWEKEGSELKDVYFLPDSDPSHFSLAQNTLMKSFYNNIINSILSVDKKDKKSTIILVRVKTVNELFSQYFAETLVSEVSDFYKETKTKKSADNLAILQHQTDSVKNALYSSIMGVASLSDVNPNPNPSRQGLRVPGQQRQFDVQVNQTILNQLIPNLEAAKISLRKETPLIQVIDKPVLPLSMEGYGKFKGLVTGGVIGGMIILFFLIIKKVIVDMMR